MSNQPARPSSNPPPLPSLLRLRSARAALDRTDTPESTASVKTATEEIVANARLLDSARADLERQAPVPR